MSQPCHHHWSRAGRTGHGPAAGESRRWKSRFWKNNRASAAALRPSKATATALTSAPHFFFIRRFYRKFFKPSGATCSQEVPMTRLDPQYRLTFGAGGELNATSDLERMVAEIAQTLAGGRAAVPEIHGVQSCEAGEVRAVPAGAVSRVDEPAQRAPACGAAVSEAVEIAARGTGGLFPRPAPATRLHLSIEISRHVAVPVPEPVFHPVVSRIRARHLASDRRLQCHHAQHGARGAGARRENPAQHGRWRKSCLPAGAPRACAPRRANSAPTPWC